MTVPAAGLICGGGVTQSFLARLPSVLSAVGPVKSVSLRVARRMANSLRAGYAVDDPAAVAGCDLVWIVLSDDRLDATIGELGTSLVRKNIIVCDSERDSRSIQIPGARIATLNVVDQGERIFVTEGNPPLLRVLNRILTHEHRKLIELRPSAKALFFAGVHLSGQLLLPQFAAGVEGLRAAGFTRKDAIRVAEALAARALRAYAKAGRKAWSPAAETELRRSLERDAATIGSIDSRLGDVYTAAVTQALEYFKEP